MTPFETATSSSRLAFCSSAAMVLLSPAASASRKRRIAVLNEELTDLLRRRDFSLVLIRLIWDLIFATNDAFRSLPLVKFLDLLLDERRRLSVHLAGPQTGARPLATTPEIARTIRSRVYPASASPPLTPISARANSEIAKVIIPGRHL
jgi:hypothetical protein